MRGAAVLLAALLCVLAGCQTPGESGGDAGTYVFEDGTSRHAAYGSLDFNGRGRYEFADGEVYEGEFRHGKAHGHGRSVSPEGVVYEGDWADGVERGHGRLELPDGGVYVGDFLDGSQNGSGVFTSAKGRYEGLWRGGLPEGQGIYEYADGSRYQGEWLRGQRQGKGRWTSPTGDVYDGEWAGNRPHGIGELIEATGARYRGEWLAGQRTGYGVWTGLDGDRYEGMWKNNRREGWGYARALDGAEYEGEWLANRYHGQGTLRDDGTIEAGRFERGEFITGERTLASKRRERGEFHAGLLVSGELTTAAGHDYRGRLLRADEHGALRAEPAWLSWLERFSGADPEAAELFGRALAEFVQPRQANRAEAVWRSAAASGSTPAMLGLAGLLARRDPAQAIAFLEEASARGNELATLRLATRYQTGRGVRADHRRAASLYARIAKTNLSARNNLAWLRATSPIDSVRDGAAALRDALALVVAYPEDWGYLDTLAAAQAESGAYGAAVAWQQRALTAAGNARLVPGEALAEMRAHLASYRSGQPWRMQIPSDEASEQVE